MDDQGIDIRELGWLGTCIAVWCLVALVFGQMLQVDQTSRILLLLGIVAVGVDGTLRWRLRDKH